MSRWPSPPVRVRYKKNRSQTPEENSTRKYIIYIAERYTVENYTITRTIIRRHFEIVLVEKSTRDIFHIIIMISYNVLITRTNRTTRVLPFVAYNAAADWSGSIFFFHQRTGETETAAVRFVFTFCNDNVYDVYTKAPAATHTHTRVSY